MYPIRPSIGAGIANGIAKARRLDLDHLCTEPSKGHAEKRPGEVDGNGKHADVK
jgi:hypothetical protein